MAKTTLRGLDCYLQKQFFKATLKHVKFFQRISYSTEAEGPKFSTSPASESFTVQYLINSCGLPLESALLASQKFQLKETKSLNYQSVLSLLRSFQFSDDQIAKLVSKFPSVLKSKAHDSLHPKLLYLVDNGFVGRLLPELIVINPGILFRSLNQIKPWIELIKAHLDSDEEVITAVKRSSWLQTFDLNGIVKPNIDLLLRLEVPRSAIAKLITIQPRTLMQNADRLVNSVETVKRSGLQPSSSLFVHALRVMASMSESTWKRKMETFKTLGWSEDEIMSLLRRDPHSLAGSEEKIKGLVDFYLNTMKLDRAVLTAYPRLLMFSLDGRVRPRFDVLKVLKSKKLLKENQNPAWIVTRSEKQFLEMFVNQHLDKVPKLLELYHGTVTSKEFNV